MHSNKYISVFEYSSLRVDDSIFKDSHFKMLVKYNELHGNKYFTVGYNKITFKSYIGVIQVGDRVIEILPKTDNANVNSKEAVRKWQTALLHMLNRAGYIKLNETEKAVQNKAKHNLLEIYLHAFLKEVQWLVHLGLVKKYRRVIENGNVLKGRLLIHKQIQHNSFHKERFYIEHTFYDRNNFLNSILKKGLLIICATTTNHEIKREASKLLLFFEGIDSWGGPPSQLEEIKFARKFAQYTYAIDLARLIILNFCPNMSSGSQHVLAILFDMNRLFEKYVYKTFKRREGLFSELKLNISQQSRSKFWKHKTIKPDIVVEYYPLKSPSALKIIIDTKWKIIKYDEPSDDDLKQMFVYNHHFGANRSILFYPSIKQVNSGVINYETGLSVQTFIHGCELYFAELFNEQHKIEDDFALTFLEYLTGFTPAKAS